MGVPDKYRCMDGFLMTSRDMSTEHKIAMAIGIYALNKAVMQANRVPLLGCDVSALMRLHAREGLKGSKARKMLMQ